MKSSLFKLNEVPTNVNVIYMFNKKCSNQLNIFSSDMNEGANDLGSFLNNSKKFTLELNDPIKNLKEPEELNFTYTDLNYEEKNKKKIRLMNKCSKYRFHRASTTEWALEISPNWDIIDLPYGDMENLIRDIKNNSLEEPTLVQSKEDDFVLIATKIKPPPVVTTTSIGSQTIGGILKKKTKKVRKHKGINQTGGNKGKLKKGYRFSGKKLKNGLPKIVKSKKQ
jgi:hypothetical protein